MRTFKDTAGCEWSISLTFGSMRSLKQAAIGDKHESIDLLSPDVTTEGQPLFVRLWHDDWLCLEVLHHLLGPQARTIGLTDQQLVDRFDGPVYEAAKAAFFAEWSDFFLGRGQTNLCAAISQLNAMKAEAIQQATEKLEALDVREQVAAILGTNFGRSAESLESPTPGA